MLCFWKICEILINLWDFLVGPYGGKSMHFTDNSDKLTCMDNPDFFLKFIGAVILLI